jgi:hypothetical protein
MSSRPPVRADPLPSGSAALIEIALRGRTAPAHRGGPSAATASASAAANQSRTRLEPCAAA